MRTLERATLLGLQLVPEVTARVSGGSMRPFYPSGARIAVRSPDPDETLLHRVVLFERVGRVVSHRVVADHGERLICRGDANTHLESVQRSEVVGVVSARLGPWRAIDWLKPVTEMRLARAARSLRRARGRARRILLDRAAG